MGEELSEVALIQGASRGIGLALVEALLTRSRVKRVIATSRNPQASKGLTRLKAEHGDRLDTASLDLNDEASIANATDQIRQEGVHRIHWLFNCAGVLHDEQGLAPEKRLEDITAESLEKVFRVNAFGPLLMAKHLLPFLRHPDRAILVNLSARVGSIEDNRLGGWYGYRASKAAQNMMTRTIAIELSRRARNVICVAMHPGTVDTDLSRPFQRGVPEDQLFSANRAAAQLLRVAENCSAEHHGCFLAWDGQPIPW
ncbi:MAG: SDR family oxidoreductase [Myxococcota bacterium]